MTRDDIIRMAREAGAYCQHGDFNMGHSYEFQPDRLERFAALVAAAEREACAKVCDEFESDADPDAGAVLSAAIRARGETE